MKTKAAVLTQTNQSLEIEELEIPTLKEGQVLVKIAFSGVCHSQLNEVRGLKGVDNFLPHTLGHEGSGIVQEVGPGVKKVTEGNTVILTWIKGNGFDIPSTTYRRNDGSVVNSGAISTFMNYAVVSENRVIPVSNEHSLRELPLLGCAIPTGAGIVFNTAKINKGETVAVFGVGGVGLSAIIGARLREAKSIIAIDIFNHKLELARNLGATHTINFKEQDIAACLNEITHNAGLDFSIEASGNRKAMELAFNSIRTGGGLCVIAGNLPAGETISINPIELIKGKQIVGSWGGETQPDKDIPIYLNLYKTGKLKLNSLITQTYKLEEINQALDELEKGMLGRGLIEMT
ncbi:MAG: acetoin dehydrogenase [Nitrosomonadaceae bacterium]|nr:acetoin dehydrogenase [Nitrosomonadaceae bacterium]|tara:strand:- start:1199 stop:2239 length:1041 start_codon:yes stop_codon:yes gene_type:complete